MRRGFLCSVVGGLAVGIFVCRRRLISAPQTWGETFLRKKTKKTRKYLDNADRPQGVTITTRNDRGQQQAGKTASPSPQL